MIVVAIFMLAALSHASALPSPWGGTTIGNAVRGVAVPAGGAPAPLASLAVQSGDSEAHINSLFVQSNSVLWADFGLARVTVTVDGAESFSFPLGAFDEGDHTPWSEARLGNTDLLGAKFLLLPIPFTTSATVTIQQPAGSVLSESANAIVRGASGTSGSFAGIPLSGTRLRLAVVEGATVDAGRSVVLLNSSSPGLLALALVQGGPSANFNYLAGPITGRFDGQAQAVPLAHSMAGWLLMGEGFNLGQFFGRPSGIAEYAPILGATFTAYRLFDNDPIMWRSAAQIEFTVPVTANSTGLSTYLFYYEQVQTL